MRSGTPEILTVRRDKQPSQLASRANVKHHTSSLTGISKPRFQNVHVDNRLPKHNGTDFDSLKEKHALRNTQATLAEHHSPFGRIGHSIHEFCKIRQLGSGQFGVVHMVRHNATGFLYALKTIRKNDVLASKADSERILAQLIHEMKLQSFLAHENIIKIYTCFHDDWNVYIVQELGCDGELYNLLKVRHHFSEEATSFLIRQILKGVKYLHQQKVIHRDIKPENIVLVHGIPKLCDFGWSVYSPSNVRSTLCGSPLYLSPQILVGRDYDHKVDIWAIGTLAYELYTAENPFAIESRSELAKIVTKELNITVGSNIFRSFVTSALHKNPAARPGANQLLFHAFINRYRDLETSQEICQ